MFMTKTDVLEDVIEETYELTLIAKDEDISGVRKSLGTWGASIIKEQEAQKTRLAYPIKKQAYGYISTFSIRMPKEETKKVMAGLNLEEGVLRYTLTKFDNRKVAERGEDQKPSPVKTSERRIFRPTRKPTEPVLTNEALEKKIEEILK